MSERPHSFDASLADLGGEHWPEPVPLEAHGLVADVDAAFVQQVFAVAQRQWKADVHHHCEADDLQRRLEITERVRFAHPARVGKGGLDLNGFSSDNAVAVAQFDIAQSPRRRKSKILIELPTDL